MTFNSQKEKSEELQKIVNSIDEELQNFNFRDDKVRFSSEYIGVNNRFKAAFKNLQDANKVLVKNFKSELRKERLRTRYGK